MDQSDNPLNTLENTPSRRRRRVNWRQAAELLARGMSLEGVAERLDCGVPVLRRNLRRSPPFRQRIAQAAEQQRLRVQLRLMALGDHTVAQLRLAEKLDARILQWLGKQIGLDGAAAPGGDLAARWEAALGLAAPDRTAASPASPAPEEERFMTAAELEAMLADARSATAGDGRR